MIDVCGIICGLMMGYHVSQNNLCGTIAWGILLALVALKNIIRRKS